MSQRLLTKEMVLEKQRLLTKNGTAPGIRPLHAALGCGSMTTLVKILAEIKADQAPSATQRPEALARFQSIWAEAEEVGRNSCAEEVKSLQDIIEVLSSEVERTEGELHATNARETHLIASKEELYNEVTAVQQRLTATRAAAEEYSSKAVLMLEQISTLREQHALEITNLIEKHRSYQVEQTAFTAQLEQQVRRTEASVSEKTLELARVEATLQATSSHASREAELRATAEHKLSAMESELAEARGSAATAMERVAEVQRDAMDRLSGLQTQHAAELARLLDHLSTASAHIRKGSKFTPIVQKTSDE